MNTQLIENTYGHGAIKYVPQKKDFSYHNIAMASQPMDWNTGYDVENELAIVLTIPNFKIPVKNQWSSYSCGGQAGAYKSEVSNAFAYKIFTEESAKFIYAPIHVNGGGSGAQDICKRCNVVGVSSETLCPSYQNGNSTEPFMEASQDITPLAISNASLSRSSNYAFYQPKDIETIACAIRDNQGVVCGLDGSNNGSWLSNMPQPPRSGEDTWSHWLYFGKVRMFNGKKQLGFLNSWGTSAGDMGWQWIGEEYLPFIWCMFTEIFSSTFQYNFTNNLWLGCSGVDVIALQEALRLDGEFTYPDNTNYFGLKTLNAVLAFQKKYNIMPVAGFVGNQTRAKLNSLFNKQ